VGGRHTTNQDRHAFVTVQALVILNNRLGSTYLPSLISSMKARPACFCKEFCHSCEQSSITNSTTELLFLKVVNPTTQISHYKNKMHKGQESLHTWAIKGSITVYMGHRRENLHLKEKIMD
jgi:hypothetical protein